MISYQLDFYVLRANSYGKKTFNYLVFCNDVRKSLFKHKQIYLIQFSYQQATTISWPRQII